MAIAASCLHHKKITSVKASVFFIFGSCNIHVLRAQHLPLRISVAVRAVPADVQLILGGFLVHWIVKVDGVGVLQTPVSPEQHRSKDQQGHDQYWQHDVESKRVG